MAKGSGYIKGAGILFEDSERVIIANGANGGRKSKNEKTGKMAQVWILVKAEDPVSAILSGADKAICFNCAFRGELINGELKGRKCYLTKYALSRAPKAIWKAFHRGRYERITTQEQIAKLFGGIEVRFGAYGEPVLLPFPTVKAIAAVAKTWTGYTHQWANPLYRAYADYFMASTTDADYLQAQALGWRTFTVSDHKLENQIVCPASEERGFATDCRTCGLCKGNAAATVTGKARLRSVRIAAHGPGKKHATQALNAIAA